METGWTLKLHHGVWSTTRYIRIVRQIEKFLTHAAALLALAAQAATLDPSTSPYQGIVDRNVFGLKAKVSDADDVAPVAPPPKLTLTGITTILGNKRALLTTPAVPNKPAESLMLTEGQRDGEVEVLEIDEVAGTVKVKNHGIEQTLDFKTDGVKLQTAAAPPPIAPGNPPIAPPPGALPTGAPNPPHQIPTRVMRTTPALSPTAPQPQPPRTALPPDTTRPR